MNTPPFPDWFRALTGHATPRPWQAELADGATCRDRLIRIPTGLGKTDGVLAAWAFHRLHRADDAWPRRLIWCLPMRVLVEQTAEAATKFLGKLPMANPPAVHLAMGGEDAGEWFSHPERPAVLIGTQDMLLSRALNRGYAAGRARWPAEFGLLHHDALWVMDEAQLMDVGLATSAQLQAFRGQDGGKRLRPCHTWWMSATLQPDWLRTVDTESWHAGWAAEPCQVPAARRTGGLWDIRKVPTTDAIPAAGHAAFADRIATAHAALPDGEYGRITLVVCNTVARACRTFDELRKRNPTADLRLVHGRFRPAERTEWRTAFLSKDTCTAGVDRIVVATQVVEAGVDISAGCLVTDLAPWPSLVQRFGRCARYGGRGTVIVVDRGRDEASALPYRAEELDGAWEELQSLTDAGIAELEAHEERLAPDARRRLFPFSPAHLLMRKEFDELFDTTPDLTGADLDISRFIRAGDERDVQVFWATVAAEEGPSAKRQPRRAELCAVGFLAARDWLCDEETKTNRKPRLREGVRAWVWDWLDGEWKPATRAALSPGRVVCVAVECGGYDPARGFAPESNEPVEEVRPPTKAVEPADESDRKQNGEPLSFAGWKTIACHTQEVVTEVAQIADDLRLPAELRAALELAARWHDWGKAHPAFQGSIRHARRPARNDLAKAPDDTWPKGKLYTFADEKDRRPGFRHELASALGLFALLRCYAPRHPALLGPWVEVLTRMGKNPPVAEAPPPEVIRPLLACSADVFDLVAYLVASHHGKVRVGLHAAPKDQEYRDRDERGLPIRGVRERDELPGVRLLPDADPVPAVSLSLSPAKLGLSDLTGISWRERCLGLLDRHGPAALAFLEAILRAADVRASKLKTPDPRFASEGTP